MTKAQRKEYERANQLRREAMLRFRYKRPMHEVGYNPVIQKGKSRDKANTQTTS